MKLPLLVVAFVLAILLVAPPIPTTASTRQDLDSWDIKFPIDHGLWSNEREEQFKDLQAILQTAQKKCQQLFSETPHPMKSLEYEIFQTGKSSLRRLLQQHPEDKLLLLPQKLFGSAATTIDAAHYRVCAALLFLQGHSDAAHEVLLGVTLENLEQGEYAATHRGQTNWAQEHPLTDSADILHALIHRCVEGTELGEGDHTGYQNAQYWLAGGPKLLDPPASHPVRDNLVRIAKQHTPLCVKRLVAQENKQYTIPAGGGKTRTISVPCGQWDDYAFLELCREWADGGLEKDQEEEVATLQYAEMILLLRHELMECLRRLPAADASGDRV